MTLHMKAMKITLELVILRRWVDASLFDNFQFPDFIKNLFPYLSILNRFFSSSSSSSFFFLVGFGFTCTEFDGTSEWRKQKGNESAFFLSPTRFGSNEIEFFISKMFFSLVALLAARVACGKREWDNNHLAPSWSNSCVCVQQHRCYLEWLTWKIMIIKTTRPWVESSRNEKQETRTENDVDMRQNWWLPRNHAHPTWPTTFIFMPALMFHLID